MQRGYLAKYNSSRSARGAVLVELILVAPLMLFMTGYMLRLTQILEARQVAMTISREMATQAFKNCVDITILGVPNGTNEVPVNDVDTKTAIGTCLQSVGDNFTGSWQELKPTAAVDAELEWKVQVLRAALGTIGASDCSGALPTLTTIERNSDPGASTETEGTATPEECHRNRLARAEVNFSIEPVFEFLSLNTLWGATSAAPGKGENEIVIEEVSEI